MTRGVDLALRDARAESERLRSALAAARITAAKQEADLQELRRQLGDLQQALLLKQRDLVALRQERDGFLQAKTEIAAQAVHWADVRAAGGEAQRPDTVLAHRLSELESTVHALKASLERIQHELTTLQARSMPKAKSKPMTLAGPSGHP